MSCRIVRRLLAALIATGALGVMPLAASAQTRSHTVDAPDGVTLAVQESGKADAPAIVFVHGLLGSHLNWDAQIKSARLKGFRIVTYDLRGHGLSGKPTDASAYTNGRRWADDLAAVIEATHVQKPVLVGWSLGGAVISNYLAAYGDDKIAGAVYVDGVIELKPDQIEPHPAVYRDMTSADLATHLDGERAFLELCFHTQPDAALFERLLANAAMASWDMQAAVQSMSVAAAEGLGRAHVPVLLIYGARDALVKAQPAIARARQINPEVQSVLYAHSGHAPFIEEPARFDADLGAFVDTATSRAHR